MNDDGDAFDEQYWRLAIAAAERHREYHLAMAAVYEHESNRDIQYRFLAMAKSCEDDIVTYQAHVDAMLAKQGGFLP